MTAIIETRLVRAVTSRKAQELANDFANDFDRIVVGERPAPKSEGWISAKGLDLSYLSGFVREVYYKTATLYGASAVYVRPVERDNPAFLRNELGLEDQCEELAYWSNESEDQDYQSARVWHHRPSGRCFLVGINGSNIDDAFGVYSTKEKAMDAFNDGIIDAEYNMSDESYTEA